MRKRFTKIVCVAVAAASAASFALFPACSGGYKGVTMDSSASVQSNGGFLVETADYVYFINGKAANTDENNYGSVLKGSVQRLKRSDVDSGYYGNSETVVPSVIYAGSYNAGLYIYGDYIYYTTPSNQRDIDGNVLNTNLDFKRTKLDGTGTELLWQCTDNTVDYRYVEVGDVVYILYALSENLYGTSVTDIHSVNCGTKADTILAYNVGSYVFDTENAENPYAYYTMSVPRILGGSDTWSYNQMYRVRADQTTSPREYDFSEIEDYDAAEDPVYINLGDYVFDGISMLNYSSERISQFSYAHYSGKAYTLNNSDYTYEFKWYRDGKLYYTRKSGETSSITSMFTLADDDLSAADGHVKSDWDAIEKNAEQSPFIYGSDTTEYTFFEKDGVEYALCLGSDGISRTVVENGQLGKKKILCADASATLLDLREENGVLNLYYSKTGGNGYTVNRLAVDGSDDEYDKMSTETEPSDSLTYTATAILDLDACTDWYLPEFVGNTLFFASETTGMSEFNYIMACDLTGENGIMTNKEIKDFNELYEGVTEDIEAYDDVTNSDGTASYENLSAALKYEFYTRDNAYLSELIQAYMDIEDRDEEYLYSKDSVAIYNDFITADGDWAEKYKELSKNIDADTIVYANVRDYYYRLAGRMTEEDEEKLLDVFRTDETYMQAYPTVTGNWWSNMSKGAQAGFVIGVTGGCLSVIGVATLLILAYVQEKRDRRLLAGGDGMKVDIYDDKSLDVYGDDGENR